MKLLITVIVASVYLRSSVGLQDETQRNQNSNEILSTRNQDYYYQHKLGQNQPVSQHYFPIPMNLLQRSIYSQQPQAALIIVKAYPVYLSPVQNNNMNRLGVPNLQNAQLVQYNPTQKIPLYTSTESIVPPRQHIYNHASGSNSNLYYANSIAGNPNLNQLAQLVAQQYSSSPSTSKTPAIITGLENFSAEQQSQIKTYLKNYIDTHSEETPQPTEVAEHREIMTTGDATQRKYSDKLSQQQFIEQTDWRPSHQVDTSVKNFGDKS